MTKQSHETANTANPTNPFTLPQTNTNNPFKQHAQSQWGGYVVGGVIAIIVIVILLLNHSTEKTKTVEEWVRVLTSSINEELRDTKNGPWKNVYRHIESAHATVTAKSGYVKTCQVETIDGSNKVGSNEENISRVHLVITVRWDGIIHRNGYTDFYFLLDPRQNTALEAKIIDTNAMINLEDPALWEEAGAAILGAIMAL